MSGADSDLVEVVVVETRRPFKDNEAVSADETRTRQSLSLLFVIAHECAGTMDAGLMQAFAI